MRKYRIRILLTLCIGLLTTVTAAAGEMNSGTLPSEISVSAEPSKEQIKEPSEAQIEELPNERFEGSPDENSFTDFQEDLVSGGIALFAVTDNVGPVIQSVTMDKTSAKPGESITFTAVITDESGVSGRPYIGISTPTNSVTTDTVYLTLQSGNTYKGIYTISSRATTGVYRVKWISTEDIYGNYSQKSLSKSFTVTNGIQDNTGPTIESLTMDKKVVKPGETITFTAVIHDESAIKEYPALGISVPNDRISTFSIRLREQGNDTYVGSYKIPANAVNGSYRLNWVSADDIYGNHSQKSLGSSFTVTQGISDTKGPVFQSFTMDKREAASGETITFTAVVTDESGVKGNLFLGYSAPTYNITSGNVYLKPHGNNTYVGTYTVGSNAVIGTYRINWITADDIYGNHTQYYPNTSFSVVNKTHVHTIVTDEAVEPTCTEDGLTEGSHCADCGEVLTEQDTIPATGHTEPNEDGYCNTCGEKLQDVDAPGEGEEENPGTNPGSGEEENPGTNPGGEEEENPGTNPGSGEEENPGTNPGSGEEENPGTNPGEGEEENPGTNPGEGEETKPDVNPEGGEKENPDTDQENGQEETGKNPSQTSNKGQNQTGTSQISGTKNAKTTKQTQTADTGDYSNPELWLLILTGDLAVILLLLQHRRNRRYKA